MIHRSSVPNTVVREAKDRGMSAVAREHPEPMTQQRPSAAMWRIVEIQVSPLSQVEAT